MSIDRFADDAALCEDDNRMLHRIARARLPKQANEGDCIRVYNDGRVDLDEEQTKQRKERIMKLQSRLFSQE